MAVIISVVWHLFLGTAFSIVVTPVKLSPVSKFSNVNFLGPLLLEGLGAKTDIKIKPDYARVSPERKITYEEKFYAKIERSKRQVPTKKLDNLDVYASRQISQGPVSLYSKSLAPFFYSEQQEYEPRVYDVTGQVAGRKVIYKPQLPVSVKWPVKMTQDLDIDSFDMMLRFYVSPGGEVESVEKIYSSGYPEVDIIGIRYIKMWKFGPVEGSAPQMGMIRINFRQK